MPQSGTGSL